MKKIIVILIILFVLSGCKNNNETLVELENLEEELVELEEKNDLLNERIAEYEDLIEFHETTIMEQGFLINSYEERLLELETSDDVTDNPIINAQTVDLSFYYDDDAHEIMFIDGDLSSVQYVNQTPNINVQQHVHIIGNETELTEPVDFETLSLSIGSEGILEIDILGSIYEVTLYSVLFDEDKGTFLPDEVVYDFGDLTNTILMLETNFPEGMPYQLVQWKNSKDEIKKFYISYDGYGFGGTVLFSEQ